MSMGQEQSDDPFAWLRWHISSIHICPIYSISNQFRQNDQGRREAVKNWEKEAEAEEETPDEERAKQGSTTSAGDQRRMLEIDSS